MGLFRKPVVRGKVWVSSVIPDEARQPQQNDLITRSGYLPQPQEFLTAFPPELRAAEEDEARTIVFLKWEAFAVGFYGGGERISGTATAAVLGCRAEVFDKAVSKVIAKKRFQGSSPPNDILTSQQSSGLYSHVGRVVSGGAPTEAIKDWLGKFRTADVGTESQLNDEERTKETRLEREKTGLRRLGRKTQ